MGWLKNRKHKSLIKKAIKDAKRKSLEIEDRVYICQYPKCPKGLSLLARFKCPYCKEYHCEKHRLPEDHKCENPQLPKSMKKGFGSKAIISLSTGGEASAQEN